MNQTQSLTHNNPQSLDAGLQAQLASLKPLDTPALRLELGRSIGSVATQMIRMAAIVRTLEERGEDLSDLRFGIIEHLRNVASGKLLPDALVKFHGAPTMLGRIVGLPVSDQRRLVNGKPLSVVVLKTGGVGHNLRHPLEMNPEEIRQVFASNKIRNEDEQISYLYSKRHVERSVPNNVRAQGSVSVDTNRKGIVVTGVKLFISRGELERFLSRMGAAPKPSGVVANLVVSPTMKMCARCGEDGPPNNFGECPKCGSVKWETITGGTREVVMDGIEDGEATEDGGGD